MISDSMISDLKDVLNTDELSADRVHGGDINESAKITLPDGTLYFLKWNTSAPEDLFEKEALGLKLLGKVKSGLVIPKVRHVEDNYLLMDYISEGGGKVTSAYDSGKGLARLHKTSAELFGLDHDNYIGKLPQSNHQHTNWVDFFALERIEPQIKMGVEAGKLDRALLLKVQGLYKKLGSVFPSEPPSLLHGDLWSGNFMFTDNGRGSIYDPAVYFGHREMDLAMTRLFGGFSANFYDGYNEEYPLEGGFDSRVSICNLYPILVHANLFGGSYCRQAENIISRYA